MKRTTKRVLFMLAAWTVGGPLAAMHPNLPLGFDPDRAYQRGLDQVDQVDLFSGRLSVVLPMGPFALVYNSNVWRYEIVVEDGEERIRADPDRLGTGGLGWHLGLGEVYSPVHWYNATGRWLYVGDDGNRHVFYQDLHNNEDDGDALVLYTRDGSYLRMVRPPAPATNFWLDVEFPDGTTRRFDSGTGGLGTRYRLIKVWDRFASPEDPDLTVTYNAEDTLRTVTDRYGRSHVITLTDQFSPRFERTVTRIDVEAFGGQRLIYDFEYSDIFVNTSCKDDAAATPARIRAPHLKRIDNQADGTSYTFFEDGELFYHNLCLAGIEDLPGTLTGVNLPTGGKIRWTYQEYEFPPAESTSVFNASAGVASRTLLDADDTPYGGGNATWTYKTTKQSAAQTGGHPEMHTEVVNPTGDCSKHFFDAIYWKNSGTGEGWERGLPFVYTEEMAGRYLSAQVFSSNTGGGSCAGTKLRSTYLRFRRDLTPGPSAPLSDWPNLNRQLQARRIVYHDDEDRYADTEHSDFDGIGHFRRTVTTGTFRDDSATAERRETFTRYNRVDGTYFTAGYEPPAPSDPWVLGIFDYTEVTEDDAVGESTKRVEYGFEYDTGFLFCTRTLESGTQRGAGDVLSEYVRNGLGQVVDVKLYGGDRQTLATGGADCGTVPAQPAYWDTHEYQYGRRTSTRPRTAAGGDGPFLTYDVDLDPSTGRIVHQRDPAGFQVTYDYDAVGRLTAVTPEEGARSTYDYVAPTPTSPASVTATIWNEAGAVAVNQQEIVYDDFGRRCRERRTMPGGEWSDRETLRNARGWTTSVSQWGDPAKVTRLLDFDPFGRPATVRPPDGTGRDVRITYQGDRLQIRETQLALDGGDTYVARTFEHDRYRRLRRVEEPSGSGGAMTPTVYVYDVDGRLTRMTSGTNPGQVRAFDYDNRGFLVAETHPEKGPAGGGSVQYFDYDARGLPGRRLDGPHDLAFSYDLVGRLLNVRDRNQGNRMLTNFGYDTAVGRGMGKVAFATRFNYVDLPWNAAGEERVRIQQKYRYEGLGGAPSRKTTKLMDWDLGTVTFQQDHVYDEAGHLSQVTYPACSLAACAGTSAGTGRQVSYTWDQGLLANVDGWTSQIDYHPSGLWQRIYHANGVVDHQDQDPDFSQRPRRRYTTGVQPAAWNFDTGILSYDGSGNLKSAGTDTFVYDEVGRLREASLLGGDLVQSYAYDPFGNLTAKTTQAYGGVETETYTVDPASNRLSDDVTYDAAGNLTSRGSMAFTYDTSNRLTRQAWMFYLYDASGERVASVPNGGEGQRVVRFHLRDFGQRILSKIIFNNGEWTRDRDYVYAGDRLLARVVLTPLGSEVPYHLHLDQLGSLRLTTRDDASPTFPHLFFPYGEEWAGGGGMNDEDPMLFAGHERDFSTDTDYMHARHYSAELGRFLSADPEHGHPGAPLSWNRYAYAFGSPMSFIDPDGRAGEIPYEDLGGLAPWVWLFTESPLAKAEKTVFFVVAYGFGVTGAFFGDIVTDVFRVIPAIDREFEEKFGPGGMHLTRLTHEALVEGYFEAMGREPVDGLDEEIDDLVEAPFVDEPLVVIDPTTGKPVVIHDQVEVVGDDPSAVSSTSLGENHELFCSAYTCIEIMGELNDAQREYLNDYLRANDSVLGLGEFSCMMSPTTCFAGFGFGGGGGRPSGSLHWLYF